MNLRSDHTKRRAMTVSCWENSWIVNQTVGFCTKLKTRAKIINLSFLVWPETSSTLTPYYSLSLYKIKLYELLKVEPAFHGTLARLQKHQRCIFPPFQGTFVSISHVDFHHFFESACRAPGVHWEYDYTFGMTPDSIRSAQTSILKHLKKSKKWPS